MQTVDNKVRCGSAAGGLWPLQARDFFELREAMLSCGGAYLGLSRSAPPTFKSRHVFLNLSNHQREVLIISPRELKRRCTHGATYGSECVTRPLTLRESLKRYVREAIH